MNLIFHTCTYIHTKINKENVVCG
uniref:Uncharacterized protein n=1 Tax=Anguilla anguilla TaxID=7936 RepID=A0A0E9R5Y2_ANGAN